MAKKKPFPSPQYVPDAGGDKTRERRILPPTNQQFSLISRMDSRTCNAPGVVGSVLARSKRLSKRSSNHLGIAQGSMVLWLNRNRGQVFIP
ncbi:uncharacterized protein PpBr36_09589 [Pyricularia pennisetigena]|uniref:uncharacterized protein n=1 Tax=Pyricularia pennisetigena TaxID=1578925 RepID=UPI001153380C|nr:uncharacterized protein PpBr36_09589 [Pyricularia pennisetigena]TLS21906.1 hypothetical protein PpBr36_09589 [Pyricularia pennisetigena]